MGSAHIRCISVRWCPGLARARTSINHSLTRARSLALLSTWMVRASTTSTYLVIDAGAACATCKPAPRFKWVGGLAGGRIGGRVFIWVGRWVDLYGCAHACG